MEAGKVREGNEVARWEGGKVGGSWFCLRVRDAE